MRVNRAELLQRLESVRPGIDLKDRFEQSSCFVFQNEEVVTFNDEVSCRAPSGFADDFTGAVKADRLLKILHKMPEDELDMEVEDDQTVLFRGKNRQFRMPLQADINLPIGTVEAPGDWKKLHEEFGEALTIVQECAGTNQEFFGLTCVHITPKWVEAFDNDQLARYRLKTGVQDKFLVRRDSLKQIVGLDMTEFSEAEAWVHFRNPTGLVFSCRKWVEEYPELTSMFDMEDGEPATLPKGLIKAAERAEVFSSEVSDDNKVRVEIIKGKIRVTGEGTNGEYQEIRNLKYAGANLEFRISPKLLMELAKRHNDCLVSERRLKVDGGKWTYATDLGVKTDAESDDHAD